MMRGRRSTFHRRRGAAIYAVTLMIGMAVTGAAATLLSMQMANRRLNKNIVLARQAELSTAAGLEWALGKYGQASSWRALAVPGEPQSQNLGSAGIATISLTDPDGDFTDDDTDAVPLTVSAAVNGANYGLLADLAPHPHETLARALYASGTVTFTSGASVAGPVHASGGFVGVAGISTGDNGGFSTLNSGVVVGTMPAVTRVASVESSPALPWSFYSTRGTSLTAEAVPLFPVDLLQTLYGLLYFRVAQESLGETWSTRGSVNANGIYVIDAGGRSVGIEDLYVRGTLIVTNTNVLNTIHFTGGCRLEPGSLGYPTLIITGPAQKVIFSPTGPLNEVAAGIDFNRDGDSTDTIQSGLFGITWCGASPLELGGAGVPHTGSIIADNVTISNTVILNDDTTLATRLVHGFTDRKLHLTKGSVREAAP